MADVFNGTPSLRASPAGLRTQSSGAEKLADGLSSASAPPAAASTWQVNAGAVNVSSARTGKALATFAARVQATAAQLVLAATAYERQDAESATRLRELGNAGFI